MTSQVSSPNAGTMNAAYTAKNPYSPKVDEPFHRACMPIASSSPGSGSSTRRTRWRSPDSAAMPKPMPVSTVNRGCANGDMTTRTKKVAAVTEAIAAVPGDLVLAEGGAEIEDVLGEGEAGGGEAGDDDAVDDPGEVPSAEEEDQQDGGRLGGLLDDRRDDRRPEGVGAGRVGGGRRYPSGREAVGDDRDERRRAGTPGEGEEQIPPGPRLDPVEPAERRDEQRHGQHGQSEPDQEALGAGLFADQGEDDETGEREQA